MRVLPLHELMHLIPIELCDLAARITNAWPDRPDGSEAQQNALVNLSNICPVLANRALEPSRTRRPPGAACELPGRAKRIQEAGTRGGCPIVALYS